MHDLAGRVGITPGGVPVAQAGAGADQNLLALHAMQVVLQQTASRLPALESQVAGTNQVIEVIGDGRQGEIEEIAGWERLPAGVHPIMAGGLAQRQGFVKPAALDENEREIMHRVDCPGRDTQRAPQAYRLLVCRGRAESVALVLLLDQAKGQEVVLPEQRVVLAGESQSLAYHAGSSRIFADAGQDGPQADQACSVASRQPIRCNLVESLDDLPARWRLPGKVGYPALEDRQLGRAQHHRVGETVEPAAQDAQLEIL